jgi:trehalose 6-phosphate synthase/phosphatase
MERWFGELHIGLHAEHGLWSRLPASANWSMPRPVKAEWKELVRPVLDHFTAATHGTFVEEKTVGLAWHYRAARADHTNGANFGDVQARELRLLLSDLLSNSPVEVLAGNKVVEVRPQGINKGSIVPAILAQAREPYAIIAIGDDRTDEDLFEALPEGSLTAHVGDGSTAALYRLDSIHDVRKLLAQIAE